MVSIPDWSKFSRLHESLKEPNNVLLTKYYKQREEEAIRQAEEQGYFRTPSQEFLVHSCGSLNTVNGHKAKDVSRLKLIKLVGVHLRKIGDINYCVSLRICVLSNNFLTKIDGLAACRQLIKLDLHGNQLSSVPSIAFWSGLRKLKFLYLHDNPLGKYETLQSLATCPNLIGLTLFDTPLSLKRNYRHHVVNSVWSLKALDRHIISDEEIIEDAVFPGKYGTLHPGFKIDLCPTTPKESTYENELKGIQLVEARMNKIMAHRSPVLIVQRFIRGYLTRKFLGIHTNQKSKLIQSPNKIPTVPSDTVPPPPPSSSPAFGPTTSGQDISENVGIDFEIYMKNRRPGSAAASERTTTSFQIESAFGPHPSPMDGTEPCPTPTSWDVLPKKKKNLMINLSKLQSGTFQSLYDEGIAVETIIPSETPEHMMAADGKKKGKKKKEEKERKVKSVKQFFGPVVESSSSPDETPRGLESDEDIPITQYRLRGFKPEIVLVDPTTEMILSKQDAGKLIRDAEADHHRQQHEMPLPKIVPKKGINTDQRVFARVHGTMGMSCLLAVHQAYRDRERAEKTASKMEHILNLREEREQAKERIRLFHEEKRLHALQMRDEDRSNMLDVLEKRELHRLNYLDKKQEFRNKSGDLSKSYRADLSFMTEFSNQHTSVSNALMRHDRMSKYEDSLQARSDKVHSHKASEGDQQQMVKKYMEHRQLMRQTESAMSRAALDTRMLQEANDRVMEARTRVAQQKARRETVQAFYPLPQTTPAPPTSNSAPASVPHGLSRWEANVLLHQGRVGKHPAAVT